MSDSLAYDMPPKGGIIAPSSAAVVVGLPVPQRVVLHRITVTQTAGASVAFTIQFFRTQKAAQGTNDTDADGNVVPPEALQVTPALNGTAGKLAYYSDTGSGGSGFQFGSNNDPAAIGSRTLWARLTPAGAGTFCIDLGWRA